MIEEAFQYMAAHPVPGVLCEFGVWQGGGLEAITHYANFLGGNIPIYGFDSFTGMPVTEVVFTNEHKIDWCPGAYGDTSIHQVQRRVPGAVLVQGVFADLAPLSAYGISKVRFARIDCDIYEGYRDALRLLTPCISPGTMLLFDEAVAPDDVRYHDSIRDSGERAVQEWKDRTGFRLKTLNSKWTECLTVVE